MSDNVIKSTDINKKSEDVEKAPAKKAPAKKAAAKKTTAKAESNNGKQIVVFESGASYSSHGLRFTKEDRIQEVDSDVAEILLSLDNFRLPNQDEIDLFLSSKED